MWHKVSFVTSYFLVLHISDVRHGRFIFVPEDLFRIALSYVRNPEGTSDLFKRKKRLVFKMFYDTVLIQLTLFHGGNTFA